MILMHSIIYLYLFFSHDPLWTYRCELKHTSIDLSYILDQKICKFSVIPRPSPIPQLSQNLQSRDEATIFKAIICCHDNGCLVLNAANRSSVHYFMVFKLIFKLCNLFVSVAFPVHSIQEQSFTRTVKLEIILESSLLLTPLFSSFLPTPALYIQSSSKTHKYHGRTLTSTISLTPTTLVHANIIGCSDFFRSLLPSILSPALSPYQALSLIEIRMIFFNT